MGEFGSSFFGSASFGGEPNPLLLFEIDAEMTTRARVLQARSLTDGTSFRAVEFAVGRGGFDPFEYRAAAPVNPDATTLDEEVFRDDLDHFERSNPRCGIFFCILEKAEANVTLGEVAIIAEILDSPIGSEIGNQFLMAIAHFPLVAKNSDMRFGFRVLLQT
jgi:hypothetical protein